jgi:secernin
VVESHSSRGPGNVEMQHQSLADPGAAAAVVSRPTWLRGAEQGVNEHRVAVGSEKIWTVDDPRGQPPALLGMDLVRLVLERARDADEGLDVLAELLTEHGQGGSGEAGRDVPYYSSFLIADPSRAWIVETSGRRFAARPAGNGAAISNRVSIGTDWTVASTDVEAGTDIDTWRSPRIPTGIADHRLAATQTCVANATTPRELVATLRHHGTEPWGAPGSEAGAVCPPPAEIGADYSGVTVCMHTRGADTTTAAMVCELPSDPAEGVRAWFALGSPCVSLFVPAFPPAVAPELARPEQWERFARLRERVEHDGEALAQIRAELAPVETELWEQADECATRSAAEQARFVSQAYAPVDAALRRLDR